MEEDTKVSIGVNIPKVRIEMQHYLREHSDQTSQYIIDEIEKQLSEQSIKGRITKIVTELIDGAILSVQSDYELKKIISGHIKDSIISSMRITK